MRSAAVSGVRDVNRDRELTLYRSHRFRTGHCRLSLCLPADRFPSSHSRMRHPHLGADRTRRIEGDGSGRGKLAISGYQVEPAELELEHASERWEIVWMGVCGAVFTARRR